MAYFDCIVGGSGKGNTLVVTCTDELAGATITCTNGTKTYTKTCPSTSPYEVTFYGLVAGTWTVSATVSGNTYTTTVVVVDCAALLGFSWRTWVDTARFLDSTDYNSLDEVLADELAVRELCLEHNCVDYLADITTASEDVETIINNDLFAKWVNNSDYSLDILGANTVIKALMDEADKYGYGEWVITDNTTTPPTWGPKGNVPIMTSNTAPYGVASSSGALETGYEAWKAFDGIGADAFDCWHSTQMANPWLQYKFTNPICVKKLFIKDRNSAVTAFTTKLQASNDGITFTDIQNLTDYVPSTNAEHVIDINNSEYYLYYRLAFTTPVDNRYAMIGMLQFYGRELWKQENSQYVPDYSEKEFETGTTKKWLYDHGLELETLNSYRGIISKDNNDVSVANNGGTAGTVGCELDTTSYNLLRAKIESFLNYAVLYGGTTGLSITAYTVATSNNTPNTIAVDVSSLNQNSSVGVQTQLYNSANSNVRLKELWLE